MKLQDKLKELGFTFSDKYFKNSAYLFPDGTFLNVDELHTVKSELKFAPPGFWNCHSMIDNYIKCHDLLTKDELHELHEKRKSYHSPSCVAPCNEEILKFTDNAIVVNSGVYKTFDGNYVDLPPEELTTKQYEALTQYLDDLSYQGQRKEFQLAFYGKVTKYALIPEEVDNIIKEIKKLYNIEKD